jgi:hypothetical protein
MVGGHRVKYRYFASVDYASIKTNPSIAWRRFKAWRGVRAGRQVS